MIRKSLMSKAYVEVLEILKYIPKEDYEKIPSEIIKNMQLNKEKEYKYEVQNFENFSSQNMQKETEAILAIFFMDYWATKEQRNGIIAKDNNYLKILENERRKRYNPDDIFKKSNEIKKLNNNEHKLHSDESNKSFFAKFINSRRIK